MKLTRNEKTDDKGVYVVTIANGERLIVCSNHGKLIIDHRGEDMNVFHVTADRRRIELGKFENKVLI